MFSTEITIKLNGLNLGELYFKIGNFDLAIKCFNEKLSQAESEQSWDEWAKILSFLIRIESERLNFNELEVLLKKAKKQNLTNNSSLYYVSGIAETYAGNIQIAKDQFSLALNTQKNIREKNQAVFGLAAIASQEKDFLKCLDILNQIEIDDSATDMQISRLLLSAVCYREIGHYADTLNLLNEAEKICHLEQNLYMVINCLFQRGSLFFKQNQTDSALHYFKLCESLIRKNDMRHMQKQLTEKIQTLNDKKLKSRPKVVLRKTNSKVEIVLQDPNQKLSIDGSGQQILVRLLEFVGRNPGNTKSKEAIVNYLWKEDYHPLRHDNKVYVTIKRLRKLLNDLDSPRIIMKDIEGYYFNSEFDFEFNASERIVA